MEEKPMWMSKKKSRQLAKADVEGTRSSESQLTVKSSLSRSRSLMTIDVISVTELPGPSFNPFTVGLMLGPTLTCKVPIRTCCGIIAFVMLLGGLASIYDLLVRPNADDCVEALNRSKGGCGQFYTSDQTYNYSKHEQLVKCLYYAQTWCNDMLDAYIAAVILIITASLFASFSIFTSVILWTLAITTLKKVGILALMGTIFLGQTATSLGILSVVKYMLFRTSKASMETGREDLGALYFLMPAVGYPILLYMGVSTVTLYMHFLVEKRNSSMDDSRPNEIGEPTSPTRISSTLKVNQVAPS